MGKKGEPVCIDDEIPFDVPANWELCRLENLCSLLNPKIGEHGKYPYLNAKFLRNKTDPEIKEKGRFIQINTKVILVDGENSGEVFLTHEDGYMGSTFRLLDINSQIFDKYILKLIELWRNPLKKSKKGAAIPHLNKDIFNNIFVGIPPLNEQKRIVNQINSLMPLIIEYGDYKEKLDKLNSEFPDKLKSSILQEAIQGKLVPQNPNDEPASVLLERIKNEKERLIKEKKIKRNKNESYIFKENNHYYEKIGKKGDSIRINDKIPFEIPENWQWCKLENIVKILGDGIHGTPNYDDGGEYYFINGNNLNNGEIVFKENTKKVNYDEYIKYKKDLGKTTVLVSINGTIGNVAFYNGENVMLGKSACYFNLFDNIFKKYIKLLIETDYFMKYALNSATGTTIKNVSLKAMKNWLIPIPPLNEQKRIVKIIENIMYLI